MDSKGLLTHIEKIVTLETQQYDLIHSVVQSGESILSAELEDRITTDYKGLLQDLASLRTLLKKARIAHDAYMEAQAIYKEVLGYDAELPIYNTNVHELLHQIDEDVFEKYVARSCT